MLATQALLQGVLLSEEIIKQTLQKELQGKVVDILNLGTLDFEMKLEFGGMLWLKVYNICLY